MPRPTKAKHETNPLPVKVGKSTGMAIPEAKAEKIAAAHLSGMSVRQISKAFGTSHNSVVALIRNRVDLLERARDITAANWRTIAAMATSQLMERLPEMKDSQLGIVAGISTDKALLLTGEPTQRIEVSIAPAAEQWEAYVAELKQEAAGEIIDVAFEPADMASQPVGALPAGF